MSAVIHRFSVAPMLDWTDRHCRYLFRLLSKHAVLYTEMVTTGALLHNDPKRFLYCDSLGTAVALQLGGSDPHALAKCAELADHYGYSEINLNVGCPSNRVQNGRFGACLMAEPTLVAECIAAMTAKVTIPITVKHRIGIDNQEGYDSLYQFVDTVRQAGCKHFIIHARKAWLQGLSPKQNREIPPLNYDYVYRIKQDFPNLTISINGGIETIAQTQHHLNHVDGVMIGRAVYHQPLLLSHIDQEIYHQPNSLNLATTAVETAITTVKHMLPYIDKELNLGTRLNHITRHMLNLFQGVGGAKRWRRHLSEHAHLKGADTATVEHALALIEPDQQSCLST
ncbi:putative tRNA-dihydrouridine synthase [Piscirickettsia salmonis]|uniref:tRNA-dihydrouridine(20/20a) synthase n=1 Tax=Piscirickettsia salmonis TaxID=1238 RepID=A0A1L6TC74_PISSA|nr:tRNA dihydrouridine(20/20a) synthase DusA [Piscirickettsia salmonis]AKP74075.2 tRNA-dihydrouridine synthase A [Piscirickettsia salmonis LF-89 = ATCC VR-1361]ALB22945.1 tRNA-dihydrouridine synthase A [Piscirickettsia salmonis]ALY02896.1 tRNA dihydrouridine synthase DusA [Piscirickettsia salmonis]AMA42451.1 tRNA dihydrouridine synthase DusA [Piscirickettsia salmonis]AOS34921.1 tRNA-dihydrouridine synthase A [Piscirickettsia salmonis]